MKNKAFTLLEVIVAMLILSISTAGTFALFTVNFRDYIVIKQRLQALNQAEQVLERLRVYVSSHPNIPTDAGTVFTVGEHSPGVIRLAANPTIDGVTTPPVWNYIVQDVAGTDYRNVTVNIRWDET